MTMHQLVYKNEELEKKNLTLHTNGSLYMPAGIALDNQ